MQLSAGHNIISYPSKNLSSILSIISYYIQICLWTISIICVGVYCKISDLMYSFKLNLSMKKNQMQYNNLRSGIFKRKHLHNKIHKNICWHFNRCVCGLNTKMMRNMGFIMSVIMSGKWKFHHQMSEIVGEHVT